MKALDGKAFETRKALRNSVKQAMRWNRADVVIAELLSLGFRVEPVGIMGEKKTTLMDCCVHVMFPRRLS